MNETQIAYYSVLMDLRAKRERICAAINVVEALRPRRSEPVAIVSVSRETWALLSGAGLIPEHETAVVI